MPRPTKPDDAAAKLQIMSAFFDEALQRVDYLSELHRSGRDTEALTLCLTYVDSFAQWLYYPRRSVGQNFIEALSAHEHAAYFSLIHPLQMIRALDRIGEPGPSRAKIIGSIFPGPYYELMDRLTFASSLSSGFGPQELGLIKQEFWRGTIAAVAYYWLRNPSVHRFGSSPSLGFGSTLRHGKEPPSLALANLLPPLRSMINDACARSMNACEWFGDDSVMLDP